jgi:hypothetical protein
LSSVRHHCTISVLKRCNSSYVFSSENTSLRPDVGATLHLTASGRVARSRLGCASHPRHLLPPVTHPTRRAPSPRGFDTRVARPTRHSHPSPRPILRVLLCSPHFSLSILHPLIAKRRPGLFLNPNAVRMPSSNLPCQWPLGASAGPSQVVPGRANGTHERGRMLVVLARLPLCRLPP